MTKRSENYLKGIPTKHYDLLKEGVVALGFITVIVLILAGVMSSPDYPSIRGEDVAKRQPVAYLKTCANILAGNASIQEYGPPYTDNYGNAQQLFGFAPADWWGVSTPLDPRVDFILKPLERTVELTPQLNSSLQTFQSATLEQQNTWVNNYLAALDNAIVSNGEVNVPHGDYGPVSLMMDAMLGLGKAGLLEGALESGARLPFTIDFTRSLLFFQDDVDNTVAEALNLTTEQWGVTNETGNYPGAWWLWPYAFWYQVPPMSTSPNADIQAISIIVAIFLILFFIPFIPVLNNLPRWLRVYKLIWRDWYSNTKNVKVIKSGSKDNSDNE